MQIYKKLHRALVIMKPAYLLLIILLAWGNMQCRSQKGKTMQQQNNPLLCDRETGICEIPGSTATLPAIDMASIIEKPIKLTYFTDPICSSCWGIEPQLRKLKLEYGDSMEIDYRMGGLLPDWSYNSGGISKPSDVAHHWDEVSVYYDMPIDGDVWLEDPLPSSYPPSVAFKAAQMQDHAKAVAFLRIIREMVFCKEKYYPLGTPRPGGPGCRA
ncbi:DsbA family protein [Niabella sp. W65]|nr:DsbA family protein [Niabella sp. W65]MCH7364232.1 DsbA family protein [Niabella sp. W65]